MVSAVVLYQPFRRKLLPVLKVKLRLRLASLPLWLGCINEVLDTCRLLGVGWHFASRGVRRLETACNN